MNDVKFVEANLALTFRFSDATSVETVLTGHYPNFLSIEFADHVATATVTSGSRLVAFRVVNEDLSSAGSDFLSG